MDGNDIKVVTFGGQHKTKPVVCAGLVEFLEKQLKLAKDGKIIIFAQMSLEIDDVGDAIFSDSSYTVPHTRSQKMMFLGHFTLYFHKILDWCKKLDERI